MESQARILRIYETEDGKVPFNQWLDELKDSKTRGIIRARLNRIRLGLLGDAKAVGEGVQEFRIAFGPGYRVYFARDGETIILLLWGGDKKTQNRDIKRAKEYWRDYRRRGDAEK